MNDIGQDSEALVLVSPAVKWEWLGPISEYETVYEKKTKQNPQTLSTIKSMKCFGCFHLFFSNSWLLVLLANTSKADPGFRVPGWDPAGITCLLYNLGQVTNLPGPQDPPL